MSLSGILNVLQQYSGASASSAPSNAEQDFGKVAEAAQPAHLAEGLAQAFRSDQTPPFGEMVKNLFSQSNGEQRAGLVNQLLGASGGGIGSLVTGELASIMGGQTEVTPQQAAQLSPDAVQQLAEQAHKSNPSIVDSVSGFYAQHPTVVKALGAGALALIMSHMFEKHS
ncbi:MAG: hypothetical protein WAM39_07780 [Bryobacteraceae bacterium]